MKRRNYIHSCGIKNANTGLVQVCGLLIVLLLLPCAILGGDDGSKSKKPLKLSGDLRLRSESDYNVTDKDDRHRLRYRFRLKMVYKWGSKNNKEVGARITSGKPSDQQSPHQTFGDSFTTKNISLDRAYFKYSFNSGWLWIGKNAFPFWKQNEMFWDDDVHPEGASFSYSSRGLRLTAGHYVIDDFDNFFQSSMSAAQLKFSRTFQQTALTLAGGYYLFNAKEDTGNSYDPLEGMDHKILVFSGQLKFNARFPVSIGADVMINTETPLSSIYEDQTTGIVAQAVVGKLKKRGDWLLAAYFARIEKYAVIPNFAQDDWWRFGSGHTDSSDFKGLEFRIAYQLGNGMNLVARHYITEMLVGTKKASRFRIDLNIKF